MLKCTTLLFYVTDGAVERFYESGSDMFGFSNPIFFSITLTSGKVLIFNIGVSFSSYFIVEVFS